MKTHYDPWFIRLPDDRVVKAKSTDSVRHHIEAGHIPLNSMARRDTHEEWVQMIWLAEFADLGGGSARRPTAAGETARAPEVLSLPEMSLGDIDLKRGVSDRLDPMRLQTVGIRGLVDELIAAFDSTISNGKLLFACGVSMVGALAIFLIIRGTFEIYSKGPWLVQILGGIAAGAVLAVITAVLTRQTHLELSKMRPVQLAKAIRDVGPIAFRTFLGYAATIGVGIGVIVLLQHLPDWLERPMRGLGTTLADIIMTVIWAISLALAVLVGMVMLLSFLLPPIVVVEECSVGDALREWRSLLAEHRVRVLIYEGLALGLALAAALPVALPAYFALEQFPPLSLNWMSLAIPFMVKALAIAPAIAFLAVANLYIYLNLRYEYTSGR